MGVDGALAMSRTCCCLERLLSDSIQVVLRLLRKMTPAFPARDQISARPSGERLDADWEVAQQSICFGAFMPGGFLRL